MDRGSTYRPGRGGHQHSRVSSLVPGRRCPGIVDALTSRQGVDMIWIRLRNGGRVGRVAVIDGYQFPSSVRYRFAQHHDALTGDQIGTVEAAARQWFRLAAGHPRAKLWMPSVVVDDLWHELVLHTREYAAFCDAAFGRFLHHVPDSAASTPAAVRSR